MSNQDCRPQCASRLLGQGPQILRFRTGWVLGVEGASAGAEPVTAPRVHFDSNEVPKAGSHHPKTGNRLFDLSLALVSSPPSSRHTHIARFRFTGT